MEARRREGRAQRVHLDERREVGGVAEVVGEFSARKARAGGRFDRHHAHLAPAAQLRADERKRDAGEVRPAAGAADDDVRIVARHLQLGHGFLAHDGLVHQDVVEHRAERVFRVVMGRRDLDRFGNRDAEAARVVLVLRQDGAAGIGFGRGRRDALRTVGLHQRAAVGFLVVRHAHHVHLDLDAEQRAGEGERRSPLAGAGLGGDLLDPGFLVVERLRHCGIGLVAARGADAFVLVVDLGRRLQRLLQPARAVERRGAPLAVDVAHRFRDLDLAIGAHFLQDQRHRKQRLEVGRAHRLLGARVQHRRRRRGKVRDNVVPGLGNAGLIQNVLDGVAHG